LERVNTRPFQKLDYSRQELFLELEKPALQPLPPRRYELAEFLYPRVNIDYHIEVLGHYYSVPCGLKGQKLEVRLSARMVEVLHKNQRVASHLRDDRKGHHTTDPAHMPKAHREHLHWSPSRIIRWAAKIGPHCAKAAEEIIESRDHPEQGYRACLGILRLSKSYEPARVEAACRRALALEVCSYRSIKSILQSGKDREALPPEPSMVAVCNLHHHNVRGRDYYAETPATEPSLVTEKGAL
jgi:transposase